MKAHIGIAGAGFAGAVLARELAESGKFKVSIFDERNHVAGMAHTCRDEETGVLVHQYGPNVLNTDSDQVWEYMNNWGRIEPFTLRTKALTKRGVFSLPVNLHTINQFFDKKLSPREARDFVGSLGDNLGKEFHQNFFQGYSRKMWGQEKVSSEPVRLNYDDSFYEKKYQGIPVSGYTEIVKRILDHHDIDVRLGTRLESERKRDFDHVFWSGPMDGYFKYQLGRLSYRTLKYERFIENGDYQGCPVLQYSEEEVPFTRIIEHKHLAPWETHEKTVCFKEFSVATSETETPSIPERNNENLELLRKYRTLAESENNITFIGRLGTYQNMEMDKVISDSLQLADLCVRSDLSKWPRFSPQPLATERT